MKRISIERYNRELEANPDWQYAGLLEGETDDGGSWIMWLDASGRPEVFWPNREEDGSVVGDGIPLTREGRRKESEQRTAKMRQILADPDPVFVVQRLRASMEAIERYNRGDDPEHVAHVEQAVRKLTEKKTPPQEHGRPRAGE